MIVWIYRVYCLRPHDRRLAKHTALSEYLDGFNSCRRHTPLLYPARLRRCWQFVFIQGFLSCQYGVRAFVPFPSFFFSLSWVGSVSVWGQGAAGFYTMLLPHGHLLPDQNRRGGFQKPFAGPGPPGRSWRFEDEDVPGVRESGSAKFEVEKRAL